MGYLILCIESYNDSSLSGTRQCPLGSYCHNTDTNPNSGYTSFDNFGIAMLTCAQLITLDFWEDVYSKVRLLVFFTCLTKFTSITGLLHMLTKFKSITILQAVFFTDN